MLGVAGIVTTSACLDLSSDASDPESQATQALSRGACTAVRMVSPGPAFLGSEGAPITLTAIATCPPGSTPEYEFWVKPSGAPNWIFLPPYVSGSSSWTPPSAGSWAVTAVTRAIGAPENYQARAMSVTGTVGQANRAPVAGDDALGTTAGTPRSINVLANDADPDGDAVTVTSFTQGAHGSVAIVAGVATYTPALGFTGGDSFSYTIDDGRGLTDTATVVVTVIAGATSCSVTIAGPASGVFGEPIHLTAVAACTTGPAEIQWLHKVNSGYAAVTGFSPNLTLDFPADVVGNNMFQARVRLQGTGQMQGNSNIVTVRAIDNTPQCTALRMVAPTANQNLAAGVPAPLTAAATCPPGSTPEYQFWVKPTTTSAWIILPGFTLGSSSWTPPSPGAWNVRAVVRTTGSHVNYQIGSMSVTVNVTP
jgi:hypothetical protein